MDALADRAARAASRHPAAALSLGELARLVQDTGARVPEPVLLRALASDPTRFRVIDPWRGPWARLRVDRRTGHLPRSRSRDGSFDGCEGLLDGPRVVTFPRGPTWSPGPAGPALARMRRTLVRLGWTVDERSPTDLARWHRLVLEGARLRRGLVRTS